MHPDEVELLRAWLAEVNGPRRAQALATLEDEGCTHEAFPIKAAGGPAVVYVMEVDDVDALRHAAVTSTREIDRDHRRVMTEAHRVASATSTASETSCSSQAPSDVQEKTRWVARRSPVSRIDGLRLHTATA